MGLKTSGKINKQIIIKGETKAYSPEVGKGGRMMGKEVCMCVCVCVWYLTLCCPTDCSPPGISVHGISQARILE